MINLLPNQEKKKKVKDFYFRFAAVTLGLGGAAALVAAVALVPTYFLSAVEENLAQVRLQEQKAPPATAAEENISLAVADLNNKLRIIENAGKNAYPVSAKVINEVALRKMGDIKITQIIYEKDPLGEKKVTVLGIAPSRERLLFFRRALEDSVAFKKVDLPISNFVKGSNIEFSLELIPS